MAYGKLLYTQFPQIRTDVVWGIEIHERDYGGSAEVIILSGQPVLLRKGGKGKLFHTTHGTKAIINIVRQSGDDYSYLFTTDARKYWVKIYKDEVFYWSGFILPGQSIVGFRVVRTLSIVATDGLGSLNGVAFIDNETDLPYEGHDRVGVIIANCLLKTGLELPIRSAINLYPGIMFPLEDSDDVLENVYAQQRRFQNNDLNVVSCLTVIQELLKPLGARIVLSEGYWWIIRTADLWETTLDYREFDSEGTYVTFGSFNPTKQFTNAIGNPLFAPLKGSKLKSNPGNYSIKVIADYGLRQSIFPGFNFPASEVENFTFRHYTISVDSAWDAEKVGDDFIIRCANGDDTDQYIETDILPITINSETTNLRLRLKGGFSFGNQISRDLTVSLYIDPTLEIDPYYWNGEEWIQDPTLAGTWNIELPWAETDSPKEVSLEIDPFPAVGDLRLRFHDAANKPFIAEILLTAKIGDNDLNYSTESFNSLVNAENTEVPDAIRLLFNDAVGIDNDGQFYDGLFRVGGSRPTFPETIDWKRRYQDSSGEDAYRIRKWVAQQYIDNDELQTFDGTIKGAFSFHEVIEIPQRGNKKFVPDEVTIDLKAGTISGKFIEIKEPSNVIDLTTVPEKPLGVASISTPTQGLTYVPTGGIVISGLQKFDGYRTIKNREVLLADSPVHISFSNVFPDGTSWIFTEFRVLAADGFRLEGTVTNEDEEGFDLAIKEDGFLTAVVIKEL